jgi:hypothetical protein
VAELLYQDSLSEVWLGDCLNADDVTAVMGERKADLLCLDAPYSERTHSGHDGQAASLKESYAKRHGGRPSREQAYASRVAAGLIEGRRVIDYGFWSADDVQAFGSLWVPRCSGWAASITDHVLSVAWVDMFEGSDRYCFPPLPLVEAGSRVRMSGDGPSNWTCWVVVARPRHEPYAKWGTLGGAYIQPAERDINSAGGSDRIVGGKPIKSMCAIVSDYSRRGDLVVDPTCGGGTTLMAAKMCGRRSIGMEKDRGRAELAARRLRKSHEQGNLFEVSA